ncbi:Nramp family divalent metal transporter [Microbispora sp. CA-102843]|uniref:Nramp family divalent metal transporter n=1 Tax=Microbispora sp. CA-102843 TaxID=3239952 RepID=UPI003D8E7F6F
MTAGPLVADLRTPVTPRPERQLLRLLGPAFVAAIAYVDPGNVAANLSAGAKYGYLLVWVLVLANAMAVLVQYLSAKLGLVTGRTLPEILGDRLSRPARLLYWAQAEVTVAATDLAEVIGGAIALEILLGLPLPVGGILVGVLSTVMLELQSRHGQRAFEILVIGLLAVIAIGFAGGLLVSPVDWSGAAGGLVPRLDGSPTVLLAAGMIGATVMPHAVYLHSSLVRDRHGFHEDPRRTRRLLKVTRYDVVGALVVAGGVNVAMLLLAAAALRGVADVDTIQGAARAITAHLGVVPGLVFGVGLLASGLASTSVGSHAGAAVMDGLLHVRVPLLLRRVATLVPALIVLGLGVDPTWTLVLTQVVLSVGIPFVLVPLVWYTSRRRVMGDFANGPALRAVSGVVCAAVAALNVLLILMVVT